MRVFLKTASWIFHPLLIPLCGAGLFFWVTPHHTPTVVVQSKMLVVCIFTLVIPLLTYLLLKNLGLVQSFGLKTASERRVPLAVQCGLFFILSILAFRSSDFAALYYFFLAGLLSCFTMMVLAFFKFKASLHTAAIAGLTMFTVILSIHIKTNLLPVIALLFFTNGWVAASRLHLNAHTDRELLIGFFAGLVPQLILSNYWL